MATKLFFHAASSDVGWGQRPLLVGGNGYFHSALFNTSAGAGVSSFTNNTVAGPTAGIEVSTSGQLYDWITAPLSAAVTVSGSITWNLWASENNMSANAAINGLIYKVDGTTGAQTLIDQTARTVELGTSSAVNNFAETPGAGVSCKKGDRLRVVIYYDDAVGVNMGSGFTVSFTIDGGTGGANGDSWVQLTENLTFVSEPAGTQVFLTNTASLVSTASTDLEAWTSRGGSATSDSTNTVNGPTSPLTFATSGQYDWFTRPLTATTLSGGVRLNVRGKINAFPASPTAYVEIARVENDGTSPTVWAVAQADDFYADVEGARSFLLASDDLAISDGQRIRIRLYVGEQDLAMSTATGTMIFFWNGPTAAASGDTYATFTQTLTESVASRVVFINELYRQILGQ